MSLAVITALVSCNTTTVSQDTQMLQSKYSTVYRVDAYKYICLDSAHVYDVRITNDGRIGSIVKIK